MKKLLSLPPNLVECFHDIEKADRTEWFCTSDPIGSKLGSGGGTAWLLEACHQKVTPDSDFLTWLGKEKRILLHAGGQSRRLPGYAPSGKILTPIPVFRWVNGNVGVSSIGCSVGTHVGPGTYGIAYVEAAESGMNRESIVKTA